MTEEPYILNSEKRAKKVSHPEISAEEYLPVLPESLVRLATEMAGGHERSAPVKIPGRDELTVHLVNISLLQRLDELRSDTTLMQTIFWSVVSGLIGFLTSLFMTNQAVDKTAWIFLALLSSGAVVFGFLWIRVSKRAEALRQKIFDDAAKQTIDM